MAERTTNESILNELRSLHDDIRSIRVSETEFDQEHSDWGAHAKWSSGAQALLGDFDISTKIGLPGNRSQLDRIITDSSSSRFLEVAKSLRDMIA
ncbi:MAG: hypothetical protein MUF15_08610, partial [Acidobacteria bacterium]|nr:hypothetical protein [Acidobacteriota bacterium]